jgi:hypothetical protein
MTDFEKENIYDVAWVIYNEEDGQPDMSLSMYQQKPKVIQGTIADVEEYLNSSFQDFDEAGIIDPMHGLPWRALKVSKDGKAVYGNYSVPLCTKKIGDRWSEKDIVAERVHQLAILMQDKKFDCFKGFSHSYLMDVPKDQKEKLRIEFDELHRQGKELTKRLMELGG